MNHVFHFRLYAPDGELIRSAVNQQFLHRHSAVGSAYHIWYKFAPVNGKGWSLEVHEGDNTEPSIVIGWKHRKQKAA